MKTAVINKSTMELKAHKREGTPTPADLQQLKDLIALLINKFEKQLQDENSSDQQEYNGKKTQHIKCTTDKDLRLGTTGDVTAAWNRYGITKIKHQACRKV